MRPSRRPEIRELLRARPDGLTSREIAAALTMSYNAVTHAIERMPDVYVDRWMKVVNTYAAVYVAVEIPPDCPHPKGLYTNKVVRQHDIRARAAVERYLNGRGQAQEVQAA